jgi:hypothetical protein
MVPDKKVENINDPVHNDLHEFNKKINEDKTLAKVLQISSSLLMDFTLFSTFAYWIPFGDSGRVLYVYCVFYTIRAIT